MAGTALVLRHVAHEGLAGFAEPLAQAGFEAVVHDMGRRPLGEEALAADLLVVMGGPMAAYETDAHPWIAGEVAAIRCRIAGGGATLGICLGSQLIAAALGASVRAGPVREVGFAPIELTRQGRGSPLRHLADTPLLHWHGDTFDLPPGTELLAQTATYPQAFRLGGHVLAIQCHPEMGGTPLGPWLAGSDDYLAGAGTDAGRVQADHARFGPAAVRAGQAALKEWLGTLPE